MVKSRYSILFPTSFFWTLLGNSRCVNSFPNKWGCMKAFNVKRKKKRKRKRRGMACPGDRKNNSLVKESRQCMRDRVKCSWCLSGR